jgi:hypothetical protein
VPAIIAGPLIDPLRGNDLDKASPADVRPSTPGGGGTAFAPIPSVWGHEPGGPDSAPSSSTIAHRPSSNAEGDPMRLIGILLVIFGIIALAVPSITVMATEQPIDTGFFTIDVKRPYTIVFNPYAGIVAVIAGIVILATAPRTVVV